MTAKEAADGFWDWALRLYGQDTAREAFLRLQDRDGADVPMLLWCLWCEAQGRAITPATMAEAVAFSRGWQCEVVTPLRVLRRSMKTGVEAAPAPLAEEARERVAQTEQHAEKLQMAHLAALPREKPDGGHTSAVTLYAKMAGLALDSDDCEAMFQAMLSLDETNG